jgi:hypothetical protein
MHGVGFFRWNDSRAYFGEWVNSKMDGIGAYKWYDGRLYFGSYIEDIK